MARSASWSRKAASNGDCDPSDMELFTRVLLGERFAPPPYVESAHEVVFRRGRLIPRVGGFLSRMGGSAAAVTLGHTIIVRPDVPLTPSLLAHELAHVRQWREVPLFPLRYCLATLRYGYRENPFEVEARAFARSAPKSSTPEEAS